MRTPELAADILAAVVKAVDVPVTVKAAAVVCVIFTIQAILAFTVGSLTIALIFAIACLFCLTLKDLFKQAINYKAENDLTI